MTRAHRLWIVSELYAPELTSTGYYVTAIAEDLAKTTHVSVLCGQPTYSKRGVRAPSFETRHGVSIHRCRGTTFDKNILALRIINIITLAISTFFTALWRFRRGDRCLVLTNPPSSPYFLRVAAAARGVNCSILIHDLYPEVLDAVGMRLPRLFYRWTLRLRNRLVRSCSSVVVVGRDMAQRLTVATGRNDIEVVPNWAELEHVRPIRREDSSLRKELGLGDKFVVLCAGNIGYPNDLETALRAAAGLVDDNVTFVFLGSGSRRDWLVRQVLERRLDNVVVVAPRPREEQSDFLGASDVGLVTLVDGMLGVSVPSRGYNLLAAGRPLLGVFDENSELGLLIREEKVGWSVSPGSAEDLIAVVRSIKSDLLVLDETGARARAVAVRRCSAEAAYVRYREIFGDRRLRPPTGETSC